MRARCNCATHHKYHRYGGRGIKVCERWDDFWLFFEDMGEKPSPSHTLDRIDNDGDYEPGNCRWALPKVQARNSSTSLKLTIGGKAVPLRDVADEHGIDAGTLRKRVVDLNWPLSEACHTPAGARRASR
jgi:hypothetical protein